MIESRVEAENLNLELRQFYQHVQQALGNKLKVLHADGPRGRFTWMFNPDTGLCSNLAAWTRAKYDSKFTVYHVDKLRKHLTVQFSRAGLDTIYPFNQGASFQETAEAYDKEAANGTLYQNPLRLAWIKGHAK